MRPGELRRAMGTWPWFVATAGGLGHHERQLCDRAAHTGVDFVEHHALARFPRIDAQHGVHRYGHVVHHTTEACVE